jgi:4-hydroxybenzoate polyprenyltransferase
LDVFLVVVAALALTAVANTTNDIADLEIDRAAHPRRPLVSGAITPAAATRFAIACSLLAIGVTALVDWWLAALTVMVVAVMWIYSAHLKRYGLPGNVAVAVLGSLPFLYGAAAAHEPVKGALLVGLATPLHFAREVAKDLEDATADAAVRRTLPVAHGLPTARSAVALAVILYALGVLLVAIAHPLFALLLVPTIFLAAMAARRLYRDRQGTAGLLKAAMVIAIVALVISAR